MSLARWGTYTQGRTRNRVLFVRSSTSSSVVYLPYMITASCMRPSYRCSGKEFRGKTGISIGPSLCR